MARQTVIIDNSEYSRNGDFQPNRYQQQIDAADYYVRDLRNNSGNAHTAIIAGAGESPYVVLADAATSAIYHEKLYIKGELNICSSIEIALLTSPEEIILFHCSVVLGDVKKIQQYKTDLKKILKKLKKNKVSLKIINFGEVESNNEFWSDISADFAGDDVISVISFMPDSGMLLWEQIKSFSQFNSANDNGDAFLEYGGIDPSMDPELAMALKMSLEEEQQRQARLREANE